MVIQRIQSLFILLAIAAVVLFLFIPFGCWDEIVNNENTQLISLYGASQTALLVPAIVASVSLIIALFSFKKFSLQKSLIVLNVIIFLAMILVVIYIMCTTFAINSADVQIKPIWSGGGLCLIAGIISLIAAYRAIVRDERSLRSYNRLR